MKLINCPLNGPRNAQEFVCAGEVKNEPVQDADTKTEEFIATNAPAVFFAGQEPGADDE